MNWQERIEESLIAILAITVVVSCSLALIPAVQISVEGQQYRHVIKELKNIDYNENLKDPTYYEMKEFLARDKTDTNGDDSYICGNFANDVKRNAIGEGIRCAGVIIWFGNEKIFGAEERGHALVAFETVDRGVIFIEPQEDKEVKVAVGIPYCGNIINTIEEIEVYWPELKKG